MAPERVMIGMGSNMGDRHANLRAAAHAITLIDGVYPVALAGVYESKALVRPGSDPQPDYLNTVMAVDARLTADDLLAALLEIEAGLGRVRRESRWEPRSIDLDILLFGNLEVDAPQLRIPHPAMVNRAFVMIPLADIAPEHVIPGETLTVRELASRFYPKAVRPAGSIHLSSVSNVSG